MTEFIGARISLISKSNIRYVGTLHKIDSETSTVALEQVVSHGTEGRRNGVDELPAAENVYEYIVFRGSDVKDLQIENAIPKQPPPQPPLDDPAIMQSSARPYGAPPGPPPGQFGQPQGPPQMAPPYPYYPNQQRGFPPSPYQTAGMYGAYAPPPGVGPQMGMPPGPGMPPQHQQPPQQQQPLQQPPQQGMPPQQGSQTPQNPQQPQQKAPLQQQQQPPTGPQNRAQPQAPAGPAANRPAPGLATRPPQVAMPTTQAPQPQGQPLAPVPNGPVPAQQQQQQQQPAANVANKPVEPSSNLAASATNQSPSKAPNGPKPYKTIIPALPLTSPARTPVVPVSGPANNSAMPSGAHLGNETASISAVNDLADKVNQLAVNAAAAARSNAVPQQVENQSQAPLAPSHSNQSRPRQPGNGNFVAGRGARGGYHGGFNNQQTRKVEVPTTDYDFQYNNARLNKEDLVKEAIASGTDENQPHVTAAPENAPADGAVVIPPAPKDGFYNRQSSFFDNISCENKERAEATPGERRGGAQFRSEEQKKNLETFGQGSVDGGYAAYRGRWRGGRGRGRGGPRMRGNNFGGRGGRFVTQQAAGNGGLSS
ncbi:Scd6-like Sm domain-containing protein [Pyronema domesticum]|nr:Scd6-like Sm domain-containing protein [Pyronema domesticum]